MASKHDKIQESIYAVESELRHIAYLLGRTQQFIRLLLEASRANADLVRQIQKGRLSNRYRRILNIGGRDRLPHREAGRHVRKAVQVLKPVVVDLTAAHKEAMGRLGRLKQALRRL